MCEGVVCEGVVGVPFCSVCRSVGPVHNVLCVWGGCGGGGGKWVCGFVSTLYVDM